jgi:hypothetical protein
LALAVVLLAACGNSQTGIDGDAGAGGETGPRWSTLSPTTFYECSASFTTTLEGAVMDSQTPGAALHAKISVRDMGFADPNWTYPLHVAIVRDGAEAVVLSNESNAPPGGTFQATWDGTISGAPAPVGVYAVRTTYGCSGAPAPVVRDDTIAVVHVGGVAVTMGNGDGLYQPLLWNALAQVSKNYWSPAPTSPVLVRGTGTGAADLEQPDGTVQPYPAVWTDLGSPPVDTTGAPATVDYDLPFAVSVSTHPDLTLKFGLDAPPPSAVAAQGDTPIGAIDIRARILEGSAATDPTVADGSSGTFRFTDLPAPSVGRYDISVHVVFEYQLPDATWAPLSTETIPLRVYGLVGQETISPSDTAPYIPWVAVVDAVAGWVDGMTAEPDMVSSLVVHHVYDDLGLHYDTVHGASFYTSYASGFGGAHFDLTGFLTRANGSTVNCSDCASIVSTYANMVGCNLGYKIITQNFPLYYIKAIGTPAFTDDPFNTGKPGGFSYHAVTADPATLIFDATLHEDGDTDPGASPFLDTEIDGLTQTFYLAHLTPADVTVTHDDKTTLE